MYGKIPESEFAEDKELICSDFYCDEKHESEDYLSATKINFNDKKEDWVIPEKKAGKVSAAIKSQASIPVSACASTHAPIMSKLIRKLKKLPQPVIVPPTNTSTKHPWLLRL